jgi:hypothetical protein
MRYKESYSKMHKIKEEMKTQEMEIQDSKNCKIGEK